MRRMVLSAKSAPVWLAGASWGLLAATRAPLVLAGQGNGGLSVLWLWPPWWQPVLWGLLVLALVWGAFGLQSRWLAGRLGDIAQAGELAARAWLPSLALLLVPALEITGSALGWAAPLALGREAWPLAGLAALGCVVGQSLAAVPRPENEPAVRTPRWPAWLVLAATLAGLAGMGLAISRLNQEGGRILGGDEPQYLFITHSIAVDKDLDLANQVMLRENAVFMDPDAVIGGHARWSRQGTLISKHMPGLPVLMSPFYAWGLASGSGVRKASVLLIWLLVLLLVWETYRLCLELGIRAGPAAAGALALGLSLPLLHYGNLLFPGAAAAAFGLAAFRRLYKAALGSGRGLFLAGACAAYLPWLHERFVLISLLLAAYFVAKGLWRKRRALLCFGAPCLVSALALMAFYQIHWGQPWPPLGVHAAGSYLNPRGMFEGLAGLLVDAGEGLLVYAPLWLAGLAGLIWLIRRRPLEGALAGLIFLAAWLLAGPYADWHGGQNPPARYLVAVVPMLALGLAAGLSWGPPRFRLAALVLAVLSASAAGAVFAHLAAAYGSVQGHAVFLDWGFCFPLLGNLGPTFLAGLEPAGQSAGLALWWLALAGGAIVLLQFGRRIFAPGQAALTLAGVFAAVALAAGVAGLLGPGALANPAPQNRAALWQALAGRAEAAKLPPDLTALRLLPADYAHPPARALKQPPGAVQVPAGARPGAFIWGQYFDLPAGRYLASFHMEAKGQGDGPLAWVDAVGERGRVKLARRALSAGQMAGPVDLEFDLPRPMEAVELRVGGIGKAQLIVTGIELRPISLHR